jgi:hypothetical protein
LFPTFLEDKDCAMPHEASLKVKKNGVRILYGKNKRKRTRRFETKDKARRKVLALLDEGRLPLRSAKRLIKSIGKVSLPESLPSY